MSGDDDTYIIAVTRPAPRMDASRRFSASDVILVVRPPWADIDETTDADISMEAQRGEPVELEQLEDDLNAA